MKIRIGLLTILVLLMFAGTAAARDAGDGENWQFGLALYGWYADVSGKTVAGGDADIGAQDILDNLEMGIMGLLEARKNQWSFLVDVIYIDAKDDTAVAPVLQAEVELTNWVVTPMVAYRVVSNDRFELNALAGARYLYLKTDLALDTRAPLPPSHRSVSESDGNWDGIVGVRGSVHLPGNWFMPYHLDIGTGQSDLTWQAMAGIGYRFSKVDLVAGYRYLDWQFDNRAIFDSLDYHGPFAGIRFRF